MQFPIQIVFKLLAIAPQLYVSDADGKGIGYVRQKLLAIKEDVTVFTDETQSTAIYSIKADRIIDFNAVYHFTDVQGRSIGKVRREGIMSLWRAHYVISVGETETFEVHEESAIVRLIDGLIGQLPFIGFLTGYFFNPTYIISRAGGPEALRMIKRPSFLESTFTIEQKSAIDAGEQQSAMLALMMIVLLERARG